MLGRKVIYLRCINCSYNNVAKGIRLYDKKRNFCLNMKQFMQVRAFERYTETIKLCPLDVYVCQFLMYERISFNLLNNKLLSFRNVMHLNKIHLILSRAADNINSLCVHHNCEPFKHIKSSLGKLSSKMLCMLAVCIALSTTTFNL